MVDYPDIIAREVGGLRNTESACIVVDDYTAVSFPRSISLIERACGKVSSETGVMRVMERDLKSDTLLDALARYSVVIALMRGIGFDFRNLERIISRGARVLKFAHYTERVARECLEIDYDAVKAEGRRIGQIMRKGQEIHVSSPGGTDLTFSTHDRMPLFWSLEPKPRNLVFLPWGSVHFDPVEDFGEGTLVIDGATWQFGRVRTPFKFIVRRGRVTDVIGSGREASWMRSVLKKPFDYVNRLAELIVGLNTNATNDRNMPEGEKVRGSIAMDLGARSGIADTEVGKHTDVGSVRTVTMTVDGYTVIDRGKVVL